MTQVFIFSELDRFELRNSTKRAEEIVLKINSGDWAAVFGTEPDRGQSWQAFRVGAMVIIHPAIPGEDMPKVFLNNKEIQILEAMSFGFSAPEIAHKFHLAERTIRRKASVLRLKFNARSDAELLAKATALGIVKPDLDSIAD